MFYFSYGSNMSIKRISTRISSVEKICVACLPEHRLVFHKRSNDGSAKCDAFHSANKQDQVYGVIYRISAEQKIILDKYEGLGQGYADKTVSLTDSEGREYQAITYYALDISHSLQPYHWYKEHVLSGAKG